MNTPAERIVKEWKAQNILFFEKCSSLDLMNISRVHLEKIYCIVGGMFPNNLDNKMFRLWSVSEVVEQIDLSRMIVFGDLGIGVYLYAIDTVINDDCRVWCRMECEKEWSVVADNLDCFLEQMLNEDGDFF